MAEGSLWTRLKEARAVQIVLVYLGVCWFVVQLVSSLRELLELPDWIGPVTLVLLGVGLLVVAATAWVQSLPKTTAAEEAGELHEELGDEAEARESYQGFLRLFRNADDDVAHLVERGREGLARVGG